MLDNAQFVGTLVALVLQVVAICLAQPLRTLIPKRPWQLLMALNLCVLARRSLSAVQIGYGWSGDTYDSMAVIVGLGVSVFMLMTVTDLRKHLADEQARVLALADAAVELAVVTKKEDSLAYQLALHFIRLREDKAGAMPKREIAVG